MAIDKEEVGIPPPTSHQGRIGRGLADPAHVDLEAFPLEHHMVGFRLLGISGRKIHLAKSNQNKTYKTGGWF